jgi:hypothetical protein
MDSTSRVEVEEYSPSTAPMDGVDEPLLEGGTPRRVVGIRTKLFGDARHAA